MNDQISLQQSIHMITPLLVGCMAQL